MLTGVVSCPQNPSDSSTQGGPTRSLHSHEKHMRRYRRLLSFPGWLKRNVVGSVCYQLRIPEACVTSFMIGSLRANSAPGSTATKRSKALMIHHGQRLGTRHRLVSWTELICESVLFRELHFCQRDEHFIIVEDSHRDLKLLALAEISLVGGPAARRS